MIMVYVFLTQDSQALDWFTSTPVFCYTSLYHSVYDIPDSFMHDVGSALQAYCSETIA